MGTRLLDQLYHAFNTVRDDAIDYVKQERFDTQEKLYQALFYMDPLEGDELRYLEPRLEGAAAELYSMISEFEISGRMAWPAGDYSTVSRALKNLPRWPALARWSSAGFEAQKNTAAMEVEVRTMTIWQAFGAPYFGALWNTKHSTRRDGKVRAIPESVFTFVYAGGGAGVVAVGDGPRATPKALTALHCVSFGSKIAKSPAIVMNSLGEIGIFRTEKFSREDDYAVGTIEGMDLTPAKTSTGKSQRQATVVAYGSPSTRSMYGSPMHIEWPWQQVLRAEDFLPDEPPSDAAELEAANLQAEKELEDLVEDTYLYDFTHNFFFKKQGRIHLDQYGKIKTFGSASAIFHHTATKAGGMSGGPIFRGKVLIGIHTGYCDEGGADGKECVREYESMGVLARLALGLEYRDRVALDWVALDDV